MIRFIAKQLIQRSYDNAEGFNVGTTENLERLPKWLRRWVQADPVLLKFERELCSLECLLRFQADVYLEKSTTLFRANHERSIVSNKSEFPSAPKLTWAVLALAAGLAGIVVTASMMFGLNSQSGDRQITKIPDIQKKAEYNELIDRSVNLTRRLADRLKSNGTNATVALSDANQRLLAENNQIQDIGRSGLHFFVQKLPAATVRMFGLGTDE